MTIGLDDGVHLASPTCIASNIEHNNAQSPVTMRHKNLIK